MTDPYLDYLKRRCRRRFGQFVAEYQAVVTRLVARIVPGSDVQDVVQEVFARLGTLRPRAETVLNPRAYVLGAALNAARRHLRDKARRLHHELEGGKLKIPLSHSVLDELVARETVDRLHRAIDTLPEELRVAIHLRAIERLSYKEVAAVTGASLETVGVRIHRARALLKKSLGDKSFAVAMVYAESATERGWTSAGESSAQPATSLVEAVFTHPRTSGRLVVATCLSALALAAFLYRSTGGFDQDSNEARVATPTDQLWGERRTKSLPRDREPTFSGAGWRQAKQWPSPPLRVSETAPARRRESGHVDSAEPNDQKTGGDSMPRLATMAAPFLLTAALAAPAVAENLGDINGDGRVSFADAYQFDAWRRTRDPSLEPVPGSSDFAGVFDCTNSTFAPDREPGDGHHLGYSMPHLIYLESLRRVGRRAGRTPLPHFFEEWPEADVPEAEPPPADSRTSLEIAATIHRTRSNVASLEVLLESTTALRAISLVLSGTQLDLRPVHGEGRREDRLETSSDFYLISGGLLAYRSRFLFLDQTFSSGLTSVTFPVQLPRGTEAGIYTIDIVDAEVITASGEVIRPETSGGTLEVLREITTGIDQEFPPLEFDLEERRILGQPELRITEAEGFPGDTLTVRVQLRTPRAYNYVRFYIGYDGDALIVDEVLPLYEEPDGGGVRQEYHQMWVPVPARGARRLFLSYHASGSPAAWKYGTGERAGGLAYLTPLDEWIDLYEIRFHIRPEAAGMRTTPFAFIEQGAPRLVTTTTALFFQPYVFPNRSGCEEMESFWTFDPPAHTPAIITILGDDEPVSPPRPPIDPEVAAIRFEIGDSQGAPGRTVRLPVSLETGADLQMLRLVLRYDRSQLSFQGFEVHGGDANGNPEEAFLTRDATGFQSMICEGEGFDRICRGGLPHFAQLRGDPGLGDVLSDDVLIIDFLSALRMLGIGRGELWEAGRRYDLGSLVFRVQDDAAAEQTAVTGTEVEWQPTGWVVPTRSRTSGFPVLEERVNLEREDVPAVEVRAGTVNLSPRRQTFIRGDSNSDGALNLGDSTRTLGALFGGLGALPCEDAADANDDGILNLADAVYVLNHLFGGEAAPLPPFPDPGIDPTEDDLGCVAP